MSVTTVFLTGPMDLNFNVYSIRQGPYGDMPQLRALSTHDKTVQHLRMLHASQDSI
jgi:hypothetical protein